MLKSAEKQEKIRKVMKRQIVWLTLWLTVLSKKISQMALIPECAASAPR